MSCDTFYARVNNKPHLFIRTESRFFDITNCRIFTDDGIPEMGGLLSDAIEISAEGVAELYARFGIRKPRAKFKASKIRRFQKEEAV
jgi:hypothetical protein